MRTRPAILVLWLALAGLFLPADPGGALVVTGTGLGEALAAEDRVPVVLFLEVPFADPSDLPALEEVVAAGADALLARLGSEDFTLERRFRTVPAVTGLLTARGLDRLGEVPLVVHAALDRGGRGLLNEAVPLVRADEVHALGFTGEGVRVAVLDTGQDTDHPDLVDDLVDEACFCNGCCPGGGDTQFGPGSAEDDHGHGSNVAGIITSGGVSGPLGIAPDAGIVAIKVMDSNLTWQRTGDIVGGIDWVLTDHPEVRAVNLSLGTWDLYPGDCDNADATTRAFASAVDNLRANGILTFAASGNSASGTAMTSPACVAAALSVGAVYDRGFGPLDFPGLCSDPVTGADRVGCFTCSNSTTDLMAPGYQMTSADLGGTTSPRQGTSQAAPAAAACAALLLEAEPTLTPDQVEITLETTGVPVTDDKNGLTFPRVDCAAAVATVYTPPEPAAAFENLTPCDLYDPDNFWPMVPNDTEQAFPFVAAAGGPLMGLQVALGPALADIDLRLTDDNAVLPGAALESWTVQATGAVLDVPSVTAPVLTEGSTYWLVASTGGAVEGRWHWNVSGDRGAHAEFTIAGGWSLDRDATRGAFRIMVDADTPVDRDGDTVTDGLDNCPDDPNQNQTDLDGDCIGNQCDNCLSDPNFFQENFDGDARGNACDNCWTEDNLLQEDSDGDCPARPYDADPMCGDACQDCPTGTAPEVEPTSLRVSRQGDDLIVSFDDSLAPVQASWFNLYRGVMPGPFDSHTRVAGGCGIPGPAFTDTGAAGSGESVYYLVVAACPRSGRPDVEGSYGTQSDGTERSASGSVCP